MGLGEGTTYPALNVLLAQWIPEEERSKAGAIVYAGAPLGSTFGMVVAGLIMQHSINGWPTVFYFFGTLGVISFILNCMLCYDKPSDHPTITQTEAEYLKSKLRTHGNTPFPPWHYILRSKPVWALVVLNFGNAWGFFTLSSDMPKYLKNVLKFSVEDNGYFSSLPYLFMWLVGYAGSHLADWGIAQQKISTTAVRKIGSTISSVGPAVFIVAASYAGCDSFLVITLVTIGLTLKGCSYFSVLINALDLSPNYVGTLTGLVNGLSTLSGIISPYLVGILTPNQMLSEWRIVFWIVCTFYLVSNTIYLIYGSGELQEWNDPSFLMKMNDKAELSSKEVEELKPFRSKTEDLEM
ncbi:hypothetical protein QAD02_017198 [Eretmocerus hayati]|uniref:Uncharacterized protein n=1 Tax=Eretmocerus hayati TaxID=131215 RepID=A0ACC2PD71_9HYME|nr:hypothetical protein QAD02_017198 [Eretmocerus hayati]